MKKLALVGFVVFTFIVYSLYQRREGRVSIAPPPSIQAPSAAPSSNGEGTPAGSGSPAGSGTTTTGQYKDGKYTGTSEDAYYGTVQVRATIAGGRITQVDFLQYPNDRSTSRAINSQAMPYLQQETIQAQSSQVDIVSGATYTSEAYIQSLGSALSQAKS